SKEVFALVLSDAAPYAEPISLSQLEFLLQDDLTPPQSYCTTSNTNWSAALAIAALLHGRTLAATPNPAAVAVSQVPRQMSLI
ncbi:MAG TPA: hypothetical protein VHU41_19705, partial [Thermoanaerobaculia bacterium]|nr:hypothetical protein [Thermoanaerobaculia bacterium]